MRPFAVKVTASESAEIISPIIQIVLFPSQQYLTYYTGVYGDWNLQSGVVVHADALMWVFYQPFPSLRSDNQCLVLQGQSQASPTIFLAVGMYRFTSFIAAMRRNSLPNTILITLAPASKPQDDSLLRHEVTPLLTKWVETG